MLTIFLELAGFLCLVVAAAHVSPGLAWLVAGVGMVGKAFELETPSRRRAKGQR